MTNLGRVFDQNWAQSCPIWILTSAKWSPERAEEFFKGPRARNLRFWLVFDENPTKICYIICCIICYNILYYAILCYIMLYYAIYNSRYTAHAAVMLFTMPYRSYMVPYRVYMLPQMPYLVPYRPYRIPDCQIGPIWNHIGL